MALILIVDYTNNLNQHKNLERESERKVPRERDKESEIRTMEL